MSSSCASLQGATSVARSTSVPCSICSRISWSVAIGPGAGAQRRSRTSGPRRCQIAEEAIESARTSPNPQYLFWALWECAYSHAMANNYNALRRPPVIFCKDGDARVVVRRETYEDLHGRDV
jgi:diaminopimelate decarboxylase